MNEVVHYLNTDLDLISCEDPTPLVKAFEDSGLLYALYPADERDGLWYVTFEAEGSAADPTHEPQPPLAAMLTAIEALPEPLRALWDRCPRREFNLGFDFDCDGGPRSLRHELPPELLRRIAAAGASFQITIYRETETEPSSATQ